MKIVIKRSGLDDPIVAPSGEQAWSVSAIVGIMQQAIDNRWVVLGGDVISHEGQYTYDSWYYNRDYNICANDNVEASVRKCLDYINRYITLNGDSFYFVLVLAPVV